MAGFGRSEMSFSLMVLQITAAVTAQRELFLMVRDGDEVTLPCKSVINDQRECDGTTWLLSGSTVVPLFEHGRIHREAAAEADRLSLAADCSLVIKTVSPEDAGSYTCRQFRSGQPGPESPVYLSVTTLTEHKGTDEVTFSCSVQPFGQCEHTVRWLFVNKGVKKGSKGEKASWSTCSADVTFEVLQNKELLRCNVTDNYNREVHLFAFKPQSSGQDTGEDTVVPSIPAGRSWWWFLLVALGVAALLVTAVVVVRWRRNKASRTQDDNVGLTSNPAATQPPPPDSSQRSAHPEAELSYAHISLPKTSSSKIWGGDEAVTYSTVRAPSSSAGASADPSNLYATVNYPKP